MSVFRRSNRVPGARQATGVAALADLADLTDPEAVDAVLLELDELRATVYRQAGQLRDEQGRFVRACTAARAEEHRRALAAVAALSAMAAADPAVPAETAAFAARIEAALVRLTPVTAARRP